MEFNWLESIDSHCQIAAANEMGRYLREDIAPLEDAGEKRRAFDAWGKAPYQTPWDAIELVNELTRELGVERDELFEIWKAIYSLRLMNETNAGVCLQFIDKDTNHAVAELQQHYLEHTIGHMPEGIRKEAALEAFREIAFKTPRSKEILGRYN